MRPIALALLALPVAACTEPPAERPAPVAGWSVAQPYADVGNPLRTATLAGTAAVGDRSLPSDLVVACRADPDQSTMTVQFALPMALGFDVDPFEGPEGIGQEEPFVTVALAGEPPQDRYAAGWLDDIDTFVFSWMPEPAEVRGWIARPGADLVFTVGAAESDGPPAAAAFRLPENASGLAEVAGPCLGA